MKTPETQAHGYAGSNACPLCSKDFADKKALQHHVFNTRKHPGIIQEVWRLRLLLEEAERDKEILRGQRNEWRRLARTE